MNICDPPIFCTSASPKESTLSAGCASLEKDDAAYSRFQVTFANRKAGRRGRENALEKCINEGSDSTALGQDNEKTKEQHENNDGKQPPFFLVFEKLQIFGNNL
jgi:hypothetical protein